MWEKIKVMRISRQLFPVKLMIEQNQLENVESLNPLPVQFKSLLPGQEGCVFFSGHLNVRTCHYVLLR
jgi:hypothetical protein